MEVFRERKASTTAEEVKVLEGLTTEQKTQTNGGCPSGKHCDEFKQVPEAELLGYSMEG